MLIDGHQAPVPGGVWYASGPSTVSFWPVAVVLTCLLATGRMRRPGQVSFPAHDAAIHSRA